MAGYGSDTTTIVASHLGSAAALLFTELLHQKPQRVDVIVLLQGDRLDRAQKVKELYDGNFAEVILITGNNDLIGRGKRNEENDVRLSELKRWLIEHEVPGSAIIVDDQAMNTRDQALNTVVLAKEKGWSKLLVVTSPFHVLRAYLTFLEQVHEQRWKGQIIMQAADLPWAASPGGRIKTAREMLVVEMEKIKRYNDTATIEEGVGVLRK